jgi:hypothetical protein
MGGRTRKGSYPFARLRDGHGAAVRDRGEAMAIWAGGATSRVGMGPPGRPPRRDGDTVAQLRLGAGNAASRACPDSVETPKAITSQGNAPQYDTPRGSTPQGKAWQLDTPRPEQRTGAVCPHAMAGAA